jgi:hypothetical protein
MFIRIALFTFVLLLGQVAHAARPMTILENSYELEASSLTLPAEAGRSVFVRACNTCPGQRHTLVESTRFKVNGKEVSLAAMRQALNAEPRAFVGVAYSVKDKNLTWVRLTSADSQANGDTRKPGGNH